MKNLAFFDYQLPIIACILLFFAMISYWVSLYLPRNTNVFNIGKILIGVSNFFFATTLLIRWITEGYFPLSNLYESLLFLAWGVTFITIFVFFLLAYVCIKFSAKNNKKPTTTTHNSLLEVAWTVIPVLLLVVIAIPSFKLLYNQNDFSKGNKVLRALRNVRGKLLP